MKLFNDIQDWLPVQKTREPKQSLGFVPTMGNLHQGHLSLMKRAQEENDKVIVSIFVNQTQFNTAEDFKHYPRTLAADLELLNTAQVDYCLCPTYDMMYPDQYQVQVHETKDSLVLEGLHRPGHFNGVLTIVMKLFNVVQPTRAYFGEKDYQQCELIRKMVKALLMPIEVISCPTIREESGLALSSRNSRLSASGKNKADRFATLFHAATSCDMALENITAEGIEVEYIEDLHQRRYAAVFIDGIRLIDNYCISP